MYSFAHSTTDEIVFTGVLGEKNKEDASGKINLLTSCHCLRLFLNHSDLIQTNL